MTGETPDERFEWRETYFVLFRSADRPMLSAVEQEVRSLGGHFELHHGTADEAGRLQTLNIVSPQDHSALDIDFVSGEEVNLQVAELTKEIRAGSCLEPAKLARLPVCDARFEVMHFEELVDGADPEDIDEAFDPSALLVVLEKLIELTKGVGVDPQTGTLM